MKMCLFDLILCMLPLCREKWDEDCEATKKVARHIMVKVSVIIVQLMQHSNCGNGFVAYKTIRAKNTLELRLTNLNYLMT